MGATTFCKSQQNVCHPGPLHMLHLTCGTSSWLAPSLSQVKLIKRWGCGGGAAVGFFWEGKFLTLAANPSLLIISKNSLSYVLYTYLYSKKQIHLRKREKKVGNLPENLPQQLNHLESLTKALCSKGSRQQNPSLCSLVPDLINCFVWNWRKESFELEAAIVQSEPEEMPLGLPVHTPVLTSQDRSGVISYIKDQQELFHQIPGRYKASQTDGVNGAGPVVVSLILWSHRKTIYIISRNPRQEMVTVTLTRQGRKGKSLPKQNNA